MKSSLRRAKCVATMFSMQYARRGVFQAWTLGLYKELTDKGLKTRGYWFKVRAKQLMEEMSTAETLALCRGRFQALTEPFYLEKLQTNVKDLPLTSSLVQSWISKRWQLYRRRYMWWKL